MVISLQNIHIFLFEIENKYDKQLMLHQSCQENIKSNHAIYQNHV